jgi:hypothetical protein
VRQASGEQKAWFSKTVIVALLGTMCCACVRPALPRREPVAVLVVTVTGRVGDKAVEQFYSSKTFRIPSRPRLATVVLPLSESWGLQTFLTRPERVPPVLFSLSENGWGAPTVDGFQLDSAAVHPPDVQTSDRRPATSNPPCVAVSGFFVKGVGHAPRHPAGFRVESGEHYGAALVDPEQHALALSPVLRVRPVSPLGLTVPRDIQVKVASSSDRAVVVFGVIETPEGPKALGFSTATKPEMGGWNLLPNWGDTSFYVMDDPEHMRSECRTAGASSSSVP